MEHNEIDCIKSLIKRAESNKQIADNHITRIEFLLDLTLYVVKDKVDKNDALMAVEALYDRTLGETFIKQLALYGITIEPTNALADITKPIYVCVVYVSGQVSDPNAERIIGTMSSSTTFLDVVDCLNDAEFGEVICSDKVGETISIIIRHPVSKVDLYKLEVLKDRPEGDHWIYTQGANIRFACVGKMKSESFVCQ